jgi:hypothetical protein
MTAPLTSPALRVDVAFCPCGGITPKPVRNEWDETFCSTACRTRRDDQMRQAAVYALAVDETAKRGRS